MKLEDVSLHDLKLTYHDLIIDGELTKQTQTLVAASGIPVKGGADGRFGPNTQAAIEAFMSKAGLPDGVIDKQFADKLLKPAAAIPTEVAKAVAKLTMTDYTDCANDLQCKVAAVRAVVAVESNGGGFLPDGRPKILFEAKYFHNLTKGKYDKTNPNISSPTWNRKLYKGGAKEWDRLNEAAALDRSAALQSASWGLFQIMGANYKLCGFKTIDDFVAAMEQSEGAQLKAFIGFVKSNKLDVPLRKLNWAGFAKGYNGPSYAKNAYDKKLAAAFAKYSKA
ncbi:MAG TPA: N-acetylmuramidase domain-containing protein [Pyrinomonadaceae bacterium]|nr:N-acetylmuramidase domain-containing protein [Pyrinomonadaceae bacterium]